MFRSARFVTWAPVATVLTAALVWACSNDTSDVVDVTEPTMAEVHASPPLVPTDANLKVAFIGDTGTGSDFKKVLQLIKREGAAAMEISERELDDLLDGIDLETPMMKARATRH